ncbi:hypothetical protein [Hymenobacter swuensis]|uniref:Lipocalin-like domain-containing protein n=1 Tax=Hymenobacter swuensis DY53 TaxID=1227739 RepID=W8FCR9_9BACT|nr:hypothetical protein [Hymenobacter swuensis]AHJ99465.1 hypothetical protein Hsw_3870 [Hymenobacter swuensis DY53]
MRNFTPQTACTWSLLVACAGLAACHEAEEPEPDVQLPGKWKLEQEYRGILYFDAAGALTSRNDYTRPGETGEALEIGDSTWVLQPDYIYSAAKDGVYRQKDTTIVVTLNRPSGFNFPLTETYTISDLNAHRVVIRQRNVFTGMTHYYKWVYTR